jgi:hypothetical protein
MFRKLIALFVLFYISLLFTGCTNEDIENAVNGGSGNLAPLSILSESFVFEIDERELKLNWRSSLKVTINSSTMKSKTP